MISAFHRRLFSGDLRVKIQFGRIWSAWETALASVYSYGGGEEAPSDYASTFAKLENHYFINNGLLDHDEQILNAMERITHISGWTVKGKYDTIY